MAEDVNGSVEEQKDERVESTEEWEDERMESTEEQEGKRIESTEDTSPESGAPPPAGVEQVQAGADQSPGDGEPAGEEPAGSQVEEVKPVRFPQFAPSPKGEALGNLDLLLDVKMPLVVELGRTRMLIRDILELGPGSVIELDKAAGEPVDLLVNGKLIARGEVVVIDENFGLRITELADSIQGVAK